MKRILYILLLSLLPWLAAVAQTDSYGARMEALQTQYDNAADATGRRAALEAMTALDKSCRGEAIKKMWAELDQNTATAADYRRVGLAMAAGGEKKACKWCFRKGAEAGDPYCANRVLIEQLVELNNPEAAMVLYPKLKSFTLPLLHNMALAMYVLGTPEALKTARALADKLFALYADKENRRDVFEATEYVSYADSEALRLAGRCWSVTAITTPGAALGKFHKK